MKRDYTNGIILLVEYVEFHKKGDYMKIKRNDYLKRIIPLMNNGRVKIITGIRRCGKSFFAKNIFKDYLIDKGVREDHVIYLSLDDLSNNHLLNPLALDKYIRSLIKNEDNYYVIIDEIQRVLTIVNPLLTDGKIMAATKNDENVIGFVDVVLGLMQVNNIDLYITGSNSKFLSRDIMTEFRDRGDEIFMQPLNFKEYVDAIEASDTSRAFNEYMQYGGMPLTVSCKTSEAKEKYLNELFSMTYIKDVQERNNIRNREVLDTLTSILASNIGSLTNPSKIANTFASKLKLDVHNTTISDYLRSLEDAFIIKKAERYDIKGRKHIGATYKYYFADPGLRNTRLDFLHKDDGHVMENIIYNELIHRGFFVQIGVVEVYKNNGEGKTERRIYETDFIAKKGNQTYYIQSAYSIYNEEKMKQEIMSLNNIHDSFKKIVIVREDTPLRRDEKGIVYMGVERFLLNENSLEL